MIINIILGVIFVWIFILSLVIFSVRRHYYNLTKRTKKQHIDDILDTLLTADKKTQEEVETIKKQLLEEIRQSKFHLQKVGLVRFNPFERMGGEQSFVLAFLNQEDSGIVINYIYTRDGLRVYTKKVRNGKGAEYELSAEEKKAIEKSNLN